MRRITIHRPILILALAALPFWWFFGRPPWFRGRADWHELQYMDATTVRDVELDGRPLRVPRTTEMGEWHRIMAERYRWAAEHPLWPMGWGPSKPRPGEVLIPVPSGERRLHRFGTREERQEAYRREFHLKD